MSKNFPHHIYFHGKALPPVDPVTDRDPRVNLLREWNRLARQNAENAIVASMFEAGFKSSEPLATFSPWLLVGNCKIQIETGAVVRRTFAEHLAKHQEEERKIKDSADVCSVSLETGIRLDRC